MYHTRSPRNEGYGCGSVFDWAIESLLCPVSLTSTGAEQKGFLPLKWRGDEAVPTAHGAKNFQVHQRGPQSDPWRWVND